MIVRVTLVCFLLVGAPIKSEAEARPRARPVPIYSNQFAVHVPEGVEAASEIAEKHGFDNHGQHRDSLPTLNVRGLDSKAIGIVLLLMNDFLLCWKRWN
uniref:Peptidase S8 pro-domain domain-containing protein n=1 Tax=Vespula pensylvanica TaxID=30213 RepID=A0A834JV66_VESPE|nr:hypothetical protein H0235_017145 [Vespula pensylvanica]